MKKTVLCFLLLSMVFAMVGCAASPMKNEGLAGSMGAAGFDGVYDAPMAAPPMEGAPSGGSEDAGASQTPQYVAGQLTAGEWKDADDLAFWTKLLNRNDWYQLMEGRNLFPNKIVTAYVHDTDGNPCLNVPVQLCDNAGTVLYEARTDINGYAWLLYDLDKSGQEAAFVTANNAQYPIEDGRVDIVADGVDVTKLDLMLMVDTTGSMSDELRYLQKELEDVISRVADAGEGLSIHVSVNFYRDEGDEYVIRDFEFTSDIAKALSNLNRQDADGGGDTPEAVHKALDNIVFEHQWRGDAVKLCFFVLDAPPHYESEIQGIDAQLLASVKEAAKRGIRIIPVASSGVDTETEFLLRSWAVMTGGTYTFLTNHSGIGNDHLEPTIGQYEVELLNECLIRIICEYCGLAYSAAKMS